MTSREIAELTGKRHDNVMSDIRKMFESLNIQSIDFTSYYKDSKGRTYSQFILSREIADILLEKYKGLARIPLCLQEKAALKAIETVLKIKLKRQYRVGIYRIDGYDPVNNIAYEIDETHHRYDVEKDLERQRFIESKLKCTFVRIKV